MNMKRALFAIGLACFAAPACAEDFTASVPRTDVPIAAGASVDVPITITNTTNATSPEFDIRLPPPTTAPAGGLSYTYENRSPDACGPLFAENEITHVMHTRVPPMAAGASATCVIRVTRDAAEVDSGKTTWEVMGFGIDGRAYLSLRMGTFADIDLDAVELSRAVSSEGVRTVMRVTAHNISAMALTPTFSLDPWFAASSTQQAVVSGGCELLFPDDGVYVGPDDYLRFAPIAAGASAQCEIESSMTLSDGVVPANLAIAWLTDSATGGNVLPPEPPDLVPLPLHFADVALDRYGLSGSWADAASPAQGLVLNLSPDFSGEGRALLFGGWFTYDATPGSVQRWYTIQGNVEGTGDGYEPSAAAGIYWSFGGLFGSPQPAVTERVGQAWLRFADCNHGQIYYEFDDDINDRGAIPVTRLLPNATCALDGQPVPEVSAEYDLVGTWADPSDSAQGFVIDVDPSQHVLFAGWFTYPRVDLHAPAQRWYTLQGQLEPGAPRGSGITIYRSTGGMFDGPHPTSTVPVGDADITLLDCMHATLSYRFDSGEQAGLTGTAELQRLGDPPPTCSM